MYNGPDSLADVFDEGFIVSMQRKDPHDVFDDTSYYHVRFCDGTVRDFYDAESLFAFASMLYHYWHRNEPKEGQIWDDKSIL